MHTLPALTAAGGAHHLQAESSADVGPGLELLLLVLAQRPVEVE